jgi:alcohol dehydrogenase
MERVVEKAESLLKEWKGDSYTFGFEVLGKTGDIVARQGKRALGIMADLGQGWMAGTRQTITDSLKARGVETEIIIGAGPNAPREDVYRLALHVARRGRKSSWPSGEAVPSMPPKRPTSWRLFLPKT